MREALLPLKIPDHYKYYMFVHEFYTKTGLYIRLSMKEENSFYILVYDFYNYLLTMKFFDNSYEATKFIQTIK